MVDQAYKLREWARSAEPAAPPPSLAIPMIAVTGARAGVGTTTVAVNLAAVLADQGARVVLVDAAQGDANLAQVAGIAPSAVTYRLGDVLAGSSSAADALTPGPAGTMILAQRAATKLNCHRTRQSQRRLLGELESLQKLANLIVVDTGSGMSAWTQRFWLRAKLVILVSTTDDTAVMDTYAVLKRSTADGIVGDLRVLANRCDSDDKAAAAYNRLSAACQRFLSRSLLTLPSLPRHVANPAPDSSASPRVWESPNTRFGHAALWLGNAVNGAMQESAVAGPQRPARVASLRELSPC